MSVLPWLAKNATWIPESLVRGGFLVAANIAWALRVHSVQQLERNLAHVLAWQQAQCDGGEVDVEGVSRRAVRKLSRRGMQSYFTYFSEALTVAGRTEEQLKARIRAHGEGFEALRELASLQKGNGSAPIAMGHQGNWDYDGFLAKEEVAPVTTVAERLSDEATLQAFIHIREQLGIHILLTGTPHLTERLEEVLQQPNVVVPLLADRDLGPNGEFVQAFGSTIRVARGPATLAYDTGLPLFVVNTTRERLSRAQRHKAGTPYGYVCTIRGPLDIDRYRALPREEGIRAITQAWVDVWAEGIADAPEDWHMLQPIFIEDLDFSRLRNVPDHILDAIRKLQSEHQSS